MKIILKEKINKLDVTGNVIKVKNGYAKNFLLPKRKAVFASAKNIKLFLLSKTSNIIDKTIENLKNLSDVTILLGVNIKENKEIFGFVNKYFIHKLLKKLNIKIKYNQLNFNTTIKKPGRYQIDIVNKKHEENFVLNLILLEVSK